MPSRNGRSFHGRVQRLEAVTMGTCQRCRALEAMAPDDRRRKIHELTAQFLEVSPDQIEAVIAALRGMTRAEIAAWVASRQWSAPGS